MERQQLKWLAYAAGMLVIVQLGAVYAAVVLTIGQLYVGIDAKTPGWVVAGATLAVAAPFQPARRRIQRAVDRRVNRTRFDAARTAEAFTARLRDVIDLDTMSAEFLAVVDRTMQPTQASLWLRPTARARALHSELEADSWIIGSGGRGLGGLQRAATSVPPHAGARLYVEVDDLEQTLVKVEAYGGRVERRRTELGGDDRWYATVLDPTGVTLGLWTQNPRS